VIQGALGETCTTDYRRRETDTLCTDLRQLRTAAQGN
jgi:hypothetical protein